MNLNQAQLIGRVTRDPELRNMPNGNAVTKFGLATNYSYKDSAGAKVETTQFHNCVLFGKGAEVFAKYVHKGQEIMVTGRIEYREWEKDGIKRNATEIVVSDFQFGQRAKGDEGNTQQTAQEAPHDDYSQVEPPQDEEINVADIPF